MLHWTCGKSDTACRGGFDLELSHSCLGRKTIEGSSPYCWRKDKPPNSLSLKIRKGAEDFGTLTVISMMTLNFQSVGMTLGGSGETDTRFVDVEVRADEAGVTLGDESEPRDVEAVEMVTPRRAEVKTAVLAGGGDMVRDVRGRIPKLMKFSGRVGEEAVGVDWVVFFNGVSLLGEKNDVRGVVVDFPFFSGVVCAEVIGLEGEGSVSMLSSLWRRDLSLVVDSMSSDFLVRADMGK